jgi:hypothetical protein
VSHSNKNRTKQIQTKNKQKIATKTKQSKKPDIQTNGTEDPEIRPCSYSHLIFEKGTKTFRGKDNLFNNEFWEN